jgi:hypothetical protein
MVRQECALTPSPKGAAMTAGGLAPQSPSKLTAITCLAHSSKQRVCAPCVIDSSATPPALVEHFQQAAIFKLAWSFQTSTLAVYFVDVDHQYLRSFEERLFKHKIITFSLKYQYSA